MKTTISNNLGIPEVSFQYYADEKLAVIAGKFQVDPNSAEWQAIDRIELEFDSLDLNKSCLSQVYMKNEDPGEQHIETNRGTVLRSWIKGNKLIIEKISHFDAHGPLTFYVCSAYTAGNQKGQLVKSGYVTTGITNQPSQCVLDKKCLVVEDGYVFGLYSFKGFYGVDGGLQQEFDIIGMPTDVDVYIPVIYADTRIDKKGAAMAEGHIQNGHFSCTNPNSVTFYSNNGTFFMFFAVRTPQNNNE
ncbi:MAG TPA: hypothetical protein PL115_01365 [Bacteroidales bacterium]|jgi:hypothetical protein|nr:hypothetical protein [Bacteroidales bacterium]HPB89486.1 hypothetical protein [Bacteroidales bacterium]HPY21736.1 hypothetical protein [Bacteroidales bacterium]HQA93149.1 hypothetical protein [Bacteroidales bacterium]HQP78494.1 hypothetical protein [Bacteroidales bacterium]